MSPLETLSLFCVSTRFVCKNRDFGPLRPRQERGAKKTFGLSWAELYVCADVSGVTLNSGHKSGPCLSFHKETHSFSNRCTYVSTRKSPADDDLCLIQFCNAEQSCCCCWWQNVFATLCQVYGFGLSRDWKEPFLAMKKQRQKLASPFSVKDWVSRWSRVQRDEMVTPKMPSQGFLERQVNFENKLSHLSFRSWLSFPFIGMHSHLTYQYIILDQTKQQMTRSRKVYSTFTQPPYRAWKVTRGFFRRGLGFLKNFCLFWPDFEFDPLSGGWVGLDKNQDEGASWVALILSAFLGLENDVAWSYLWFDRNAGGSWRVMSLFPRIGGSTRQFHDQLLLLAVLVAMSFLSGLEVLLWSSGTSAARSRFLESSEWKNSASFGILLQPEINSMRKVNKLSFFFLFLSTFHWFLLNEIDG